MKRRALTGSILITAAVISKINTALDGRKQPLTFSNTRKSEKFRIATRKLAWISAFNFSDYTDDLDHNGIPGFIAFIWMNDISSHGENVQYPSGKKEGYELWLNNQ